MITIDISEDYLFPENLGTTETSTNSYTKLNYMPELMIGLLVCTLIYLSYKYYDYEKENTIH
ncbi:hypothetical protein [Psychroflexus salis]|uniref:Uncharacterized protein n=1 Tax=Psychroflexus salis TaxID=1526574 RepID=A0A916ZVY0_9FLAO|nr:hypothetical protein [Psychroflexus salis]GGE15347.1 hypothetical protein GCM10010831_15860 [Psychroflexus salis]